MINCIAQWLAYDKCGIIDISVYISCKYFVSIGCIWKLEFVSGHLIYKEIKAEDVIYIMKIKRNIATWPM